jgi:hypothetical protein
MKRIFSNLFMLISICITSYSQENTIVIESIKGGGHYCQGQHIELLCKAAGTELKYQWEKDDRLIIGQSGSTLVINVAKFDDSGIYSCLVSNSSDSIHSTEELVYIDNATSVIEQPKNTYTLYGCPVYFEVKANTINNNEWTSNYQWFKDNEPLQDSAGKYSGTKTSKLGIFKTNSNDTLPKYWCKINGICGTAETVKAGFDFLSVKITYASSDDTACIGQPKTVKIIVESNANAKLKYQWYYDNQPIWKANSTEYTIDSMTDNNWGHFHCLVSDKYFDFKLSSDTIKIYINEKPKIVEEYSRDNYKFPVGKFVNNLYVYAKAPDMNSIKYQWFKDDEKIYFGYSSVLFGRNITTADAGEYYCIVSNHCGADTSKRVKIRVIPLGVSPFDNDIAKSGYILSEPIPNPVNNTTTIRYYLPVNENIKITLRDIYGSEIAVLVNDYKLSGNYELTLDREISNLLTGTYFYNLETNNIYLTNKLTIIR